MEARESRTRITSHPHLPEMLRAAKQNQLSLSLAAIWAWEEEEEEGEEEEEAFWARNATT